MPSQPNHSIHLRFSHFTKFNNVTNIYNNEFIVAININMKWPLFIALNFDYFNMLTQFANASRPYTFDEQIKVLENSLVLERFHYRCWEKFEQRTLACFNQELFSISCFLANSLSSSYIIHTFHHEQQSLMGGNLVLDQRWPVVFTLSTSISTTDFPINILFQANVVEFLEISMF